MRPRASAALAVAALAVPLAVVAPLPAGASGVPTDPAHWTNRQLAAQLVMSGVQMDDLATARSWVSRGLGGIVLFGQPPADLRAQLSQVRSAYPVNPLVASDEEGGQVQRLRSVIYRLPSAEWQGRNRTTTQVRTSATAYGARMRRLGVDMNLAPVADLGFKGFYIERLDRAFSARPRTAAAYVRAWQSGMRRSRVAPVAKHWPGHGRATDTHRGPARTPPLSVLESTDLVPFNSALKAGIPVVMVGHLEVPGLTESGRPASLSPKALRYLRRRAGGERLIITDSLTMGAITGLGLTPAAAAVRALRAGADMVLVDNDPWTAVRRIERALDKGTYRRSAAIASVRRILAVKRFTTRPHTPTALRPVDGSTDVALTPTLSGVVRDPVGGLVTARFYVRAEGAAHRVVDGRRVVVPPGTRAAYRVPAGTLEPGTRYAWTMRACNASGYCSGLTGVRWFTTLPPALGSSLWLRPSLVRGP